jgi:hypothetical protein
MRRISHILRAGTLSIPIAIATVMLTTGTAAANVALTQVSNDPFTDAQAQHQTEVEPDTFQFGNTIVAVFQTGRVSGGGSSDIGWATSTNGGATWTNGFLPGITANSVPAGPYGQVSDAAVAFDAQDNVWLISSLGITASGADVLTSRSTNGGLTWSNPVVTATGDLDKNWIACDNTVSSPFFGNCYTEYDIVSGNSIRMKTSTNGGVSWGSALAPSGGAAGLGGQPVVRPNGTVLVPYRSSSSAAIRSFRSTNGGASWNSTVQVSTVSHHTVAGGLRESPLPSAEIDAAGTAYVAWADCRFRSGCTSNDIVIAKSNSETTWAAPIRVPIDATTSTVDHFAPGIAVDSSTSGNATRVAVTFYSYPNASCTAATCQLNVGFISSTNGGSTWSTPVQIAGPMTLSWLPNTSQGRMFGDYISTSIVPGANAYPVIPVGTAPSGGVFHLPMVVPTGGMPVVGGALAATKWTGPEPPGQSPEPPQPHR